MSESNKTREAKPESTNDHGIRANHRDHRRKSARAAHEASCQSTEAACISEVIGEGDAAHRLVKVGDWTLTVPGRDGDEPEILDTELAPRLGMELIRLRELSCWHEQAGNVTPRVSRTVRETGGRPGEQRAYSEADALFIVTRVETPTAIALTKEMIRVFMLARRGLIGSGTSLTTSDLAATVTLVSTLAEQVAALQRELASGVIGAVVAEKEILGPMRRLARLQADDRRGIRSAMRRNANILGHDLGFVGRGSKWAMLPRRKLEIAQRVIARWTDEAILADRDQRRQRREDARRRAEQSQLTFFDLTTMRTN